MALLLVAPVVHAERRAALTVGENAGDRGDAPLHFAESDAEAMHDVLVAVGGIGRESATLIRGANAAGLRAALATLSARFANEGWNKSDRLIVYVSAHASSGELHLRGSRFPVADLRRFVEESPVGIALLILDTCDAGAAVRRKGLVPLSSRLVEIEKPELTGRVVIASSGPQESSFESEEMGGSLFTQHLIAGLRGAADSSRDGRVTLQEAYAYAYAHTIESAAAAADARQTPMFDMDLRGAGEIVISELARGQARLTLAVEAPGEWVLTSMSGASQATRFVKSAGPVVFAVDAGTWRLRTRTGDHYAEDILHLHEGGQAIVTDGDLPRWSVVPAGRKGTGPSTTLITAAAIGSGAVSGLGALTGLAARIEHAFDWAREGSRPIVSVAISQLTGHATGNSLFEREVGLVVGGGLERRLGSLIVSVVGEVGGEGIQQQRAGAGSTFAIQPRVDAQFAGTWRFASALSLNVALAGGGLLVRTQERRHLQPFVLAQGGIGWTW